MATHQCSICLKKTIEEADVVNPPLVLATSACLAERGDGIHRWTTIGKVFNQVFQFEIVL